MPAEGTYSIEAVRVLDTHRTPIQKQPEMLLCLVGTSRRYYLGDELYPTFLHDDDRGGLEVAPAPHEVPLLTLTAPRVIEMDEPAATDSSGVPSIIERSPLDFAHEAGASDQGAAALEMPSSEDVPATAAPGAGQAEETATMDPPAASESRKRGRDGTDVNAPPKSLRRDHVDPRPSGSFHRGKSLAVIQLGLASTVIVPEDAPVDVSDPDPLSFADAPSRNPVDVAQSSPGIAAAGDPESENASSPAEVRSPGSVYHPEWGVTNGSLLDTPEASRQVAMGSQLRLRFEQEAKLLRMSVAQVARRDKRIQARELEIRNLEASLEAEANAKRAVEDKSAGLSQELERMRAQFSDLQVNTERLSQQVATLQQQVSGEEKLKAAFKEFKQQQDERVEQRCAEMDALCIDFDEELYPHMLIAIAGRRWVIGRGLHLAVMKCGESLELRQAFTDVVSARIAKGLSEGLRHGLEHGLKGLEVSISGSTGRPKGRVNGCDHGCPACKEEIRFADAIAANISRAEKKKRCRIVCRTHGVGSAHHARSDGVPVSAPTVVPQGLALLLVDAATQTESDDT
nr:hypothetical protein [Tanacetum cinerariifolium]